MPPSTDGLRACSTDGLRACPTNYSSTDYTWSPSYAATPFIRHALRHSPHTYRADAPPVYCEHIEHLRELGFPSRAHYFTPVVCASRIIEASVDIEIDPTCTTEDMHDLLVLCDDVSRIRPDGLSRARDAIVGAYKRKQRDELPKTPLDSMLKRIHQDEFVAYLRESTRTQSRDQRLR